MVKKQASFCILLTIILVFTSVAYPEQAGSIRGLVYDKDFDAPLSAAQVMIAETEEKVQTADEGNFIFKEVVPGNYTIVFSKDGYVRQVKANVIVSAGRMTELEVWLSGEFTEMEEFVVQDVQIGTGTEAALLDLRIESPALMDSISSDLMSQAGAGDAASALKLVAGATVQDGKYAVIRGLPDRYVVSQMNGVRLPTADADKRAVQLDQFPSQVIESIQVNKTFTPDQQGDASGGAVNVVLKGIPDRTFLKLEYGMSFNSQASGNDKFLSYEGGGLNYWGNEKNDPQLDKIGATWDGAVGGSPADAPQDYKWAVSGGGKVDFDEFRIGGFGALFYERDSSFYDDGINDKYWVDKQDLKEGRYNMTPRYGAGGPAYWDYEEEEEPAPAWTTSLFDETKSSQNVQWGGLGTLGLETENHSLKMLYMYTRDATERVTFAEDNRGKASLHKYWPQYYDESFDNLAPTDAAPKGFHTVAPVRREEAIEYTERTTHTVQFSGRHTFDFIEFDIKNYFMLLSPELDWTVAKSSAGLYQPDKRLFSTKWATKGDPKDGTHSPNVPGESYKLGHLQRIWTDIYEKSDQYSVNLKLPFEQWSGDEGYMKFGLFKDKVARDYQKDSFVIDPDKNSSGDLKYDGDYYELASAVWPYEDHPMMESEYDVDYMGKQNISAWYYMLNLPVNSYFNFIGGARFEQTELSIVNSPDRDINGETKVKWYNEYLEPVKFSADETNVSFKQNDILPSLGFEFRPWDEIIMRGCYTETVARQTFKELTPIEQQEYIGGDTFSGNPELQMSALKNYDLRLDYNPYDGGLFSFSYFHKDITDPIEYVQLEAPKYSFTRPVNYPKGKLSGFEFEIRQQMGHFWDQLNGVSLGANATFIDSEVTVPDSELERLRGIGAPAEPTRDMMNAPEYLYNLYLSYDMKDTGTKLGLFYTVRGDTLISGAGKYKDKFIPSVYETEYGTLNFSLSQNLRDNWKLKFQAKNLLNPKIQSVYRSEHVGGDVTKTSYRKGVEFSIGLSTTF